MIELRAGNRRILRGAIEPFEGTVFVDGKETDADANPTVTVRRGNGTAVATGATTTKPASTTGLYRWTPAAGDVAAVESYLVTWSVTLAATAHTLETRHEIVGGHYVDLAELREVGEVPEKISDARLVRVRKTFEDLAEEFCGVAFVPRYRRDLLSASGESDRLLLERFPARTLLSIAIDGVAQDLADYDLTRAGQVIRSGGGYFTAGNAHIAIAYEHGYEAPSDELREAAIVWIAAKVKAGAIPDRATSMDTEAGRVNLSFAGPDRPTGYPAVDAVLLKLRNEAPVVG